MSPLHPEFKSYMSYIMHDNFPATICVTFATYCTEMVKLISKLKIIIYFCNIFEKVSTK